MLISCCLVSLLQIIKNDHLIFKSLYKEYYILMENNFDFVNANKADQQIYDQSMNYSDNQNQPD